MGDITAEKVMDDVRKASNHRSKWRKISKESYDFYAGDQWDDEDKSVLEEQNRPVIVFNRTARTVNTVSGLELQNRQEATYLPREATAVDSGLSELLTNAARWCRDQCNAEDEESEMFLDGLICGEGWTETAVVYDINPDGDLDIDRIDPLEMLPDPASRKKNYEDARFLARERDFPLSEFRARFPDFKGEITPANSDYEDESEIYTVKPIAYQGNAEENAEKFPVRVVHYQYWEYETYYRTVVNGKIMEVSETKYKALGEALGTAIKQKRKTYKQCFVTGNEFVEEPSDLPGNDFSFKCMTGMRDRNRNYWFGLVELAKDPQRWANKWLSQILHILNSNAKGGILFEAGAFKNTRVAEKKWAEANSMIEVNPGFLEKIKDKAYPPQFQGLPDLMQYAVTSVQDATGVNFELIGSVGREQAGVVEDSRKQAGVNVLANFFDGKRRYSKNQGRLTAELIREYISDGRLIRIDSINGPQYVQLLKDRMSFKYDIVVADAPTSHNVKEKVFNSMMQIVPTAIQAGIPVPPEILDYSPLPSGLVMKWKALIEQQKSDPNQQKNVELEMADKEAEVQKKRADATLTVSRAKEIDVRAQSPEADPNVKLQTDHAEKMAELQLKKEIAEAELQLKREIAAAEINNKSAIETMKIQSDREAKSEMAAVASKPAVQLDTDGALTDVAKSIEMMAQASAQAAQNNNEALLAAINAMTQAVSTLNAPRISKAQRRDGTVMTAISEPMN